jgi:hypothetical protein
VEFFFFDDEEKGLFCWLDGGSASDSSGAILFEQGVQGLIVKPVSLRFDIASLSCWPQLVLITISMSLH